MSWRTSEFTLSCDQSGFQHVVEITTPFRYDKMESAPLIVCLDGAWVAGTVRDATRIMSMSGEAPEAIVVSLAFDDDSMGAYLRSRTRWFCPTQWVPPEVTGVKGLKAEEAGHAATYLDFIRDQLLPRLDAELRISERWLVGHSFSGLFGLRTLLMEPSLFDKYLLASPSIWWHDRTILEFEAACAAANDDLPAKVFLSAGAEEEALGSEFRMCSNVTEMADLLRSRNYPSLQIEDVILANNSHSSTIGAAVSRGLRSLL